ncbi:MAG TPA: hypothetical protein VL442_20515 [Mucilaginibacter sp.]|jgi:hypothetical protein|nr:hypothetical protein [Mucilaginibacter sp.]
MTTIFKSKTFRCSVAASILIIPYFLFIDQLLATLWIFIIPIGLFVIIFSFITFIFSVIFWIKNHGNYSRPYIPFCINVLAVAIVFFLPSHYRSKQHYLGSGILYNSKTNNCGYNLYTEYYNVYDQGAWGTGLNSMYLTDSVNFRKYLGVYDDGYEHIDISCKGDSIIVTKTSSEFISPQWSNPKLLERKSYSLSKLKKDHDFD